MPYTKKATNVLDNIPTQRTVSDLTAALMVYGKDDLAKMAIKSMSHAEEILERVLGTVTRDQELSVKQGAQHPAPVLDLKGMEKQVRLTSGVLETLLEKAGAAEKVKEVHKEHTGILAIAQALVEASKGIEDDAVPAVSSVLRKEVERARKATARVAAGGHPVLDEEVARQATAVWVAVDRGFDVLGACLRAAGVSYDPVYASRPTVRSPLRPVLLMTDPSLPKPKAGKKASKATKGAKTTPAGSEGASATAVVTPAPSPKP